MHAELKREKARENVLKTLGEGLHSLQDIEAHGNYGENRLPIIDNEYTVGHWNYPNADNKDYDWADSGKQKLVKSTEQKRYNETKDNSKFYLGSFKIAVGY